MHRLQRKLIDELQSIYGAYEPETNRFELKSNSVIARELFYSDSQFSRLMNGTASDGEYQRAVKVVDRYKSYLQLLQANGEQTESHIQPRTTLWRSLTTSGLFWGLFLGGILLGGVIALWVFRPNPTPQNQGQVFNAAVKDDLLRWAFEESDVSPYVDFNDLPDDCDYPCYRLQGVWKLDRPYKLPLFGEQRGFHYVASDANMYARCTSEKDSTGRRMEGYEYQQHEIWYDLKERPIDSFLTAPNSELLKPAYLNCDFQESDSYILLARVHTFFRNDFLLTRKAVKREGKVIGRQIEFEDFGEALAGISSLEVGDLREVVNRIVRQQVRDFSNPIKCGDGAIYKAYHQFEEDESLSFSCMMTTGRFPLRYTKVYRLEEQAIKNPCRPKPES